MAKIYLYLARRDKKGIKILTTFQSDKICSPTRISDIKELTLNKELENKLQSSIYDNRMLWEPWLESADSFETLKKSLKNRGYINLPLYCKPTNSLKEKVIKLKNEKLQQNEITTKIFKTHKTMMKRGK